VRFACPSCLATNRCPDKCAGLTIICCKCKTQINVPPVPGGARTRSWLTSPGWLAVLFAELLGLAGVVVGAVVLLRAGASGAAPEAAGPDGKGPALAEVGKTFLLKWDASLETAGGYYRIANPSAGLKPMGREAIPVTAQGEDNPWPASLVGETDALPSEPLKCLTLQVDIPSDQDLHGQRAVLRAEAEVEYLHQARPGAALDVRNRKVQHEQLLFLAGGEDLASLGRQERLRGVFRWIVFGGAMVILVVGVGAYVFGQKEVKIMCPKCGRTAPVTYYHEGAELSVSPCPHSSVDAAADED
jgi:hypothetical protein